MKVPNGCTMEKVKDPRGKILGFNLTQGRKTWTAKTETEALAAREADIANMCADYGDPIILDSPDGNLEERMIAYSTIQGWRYGFARKHPDQRSIFVDYRNVEHAVNGNGNYATRQECERRMRCHAADIAIRLGPAPDFAVLDDGLDYLRDGSIELEDIFNQLDKVAWCRAQAVGKARGMKFGDPYADGEILVSEYRNAERKRIANVYQSLKGVYWRFDAIASFRAGELVPLRSVPQ